MSLPRQWADVEPGGGDDPWERCHPRSGDACGARLVSAQAEATGENLAPQRSGEVSPAAVAEEALDASMSPLDLSIALHEGDYGWERSNHGAEAPEAFFDEPALDEAPEQAALEAQRARPVTRTLEDLWDETPDTCGR